MTTLTKLEGMARRAATMHDVAKIAGVSIKTVSRVVNNETGVSPELYDKVRKAIKLLDYQHNEVASNLRRGSLRTATIGLLVEDVSNPFSSAINRAVEDVARQHNTLVLTGSNDEDPAREEEIVLALTSRRVDGLIVMPASRDTGGVLRKRQTNGLTLVDSNHDRAALLRVRRSGRPVVFIDRPSPFADADSVTVDNRASSSRAVLHLAQHGHKRIAFLGDWSNIWTTAERHTGYIEGLAAAGLQLDAHIVKPDIWSSDAAQQAAAELLTGKDAPTALFTGQNLVTIGAVRALQQLGLQHRVALVGFDDFPMADLLNPAVTVIAQDPAAIGRAAAEMLFARLDGDRQPPQHLVVPTRFVERGSGEITGMVRGNK
jgi:LacI family transcriptional regulator